jgi:hypothetical protein
MRTLTIREYLLEALNRRMRERGEDIELVFERPRPTLAVVNLAEWAKGPTTMENGNG